MPAKHWLNGNLLPYCGFLMLKARAHFLNKLKISKLVLHAQHQARYKDVIKLHCKLSSLSFLLILAQLVFIICP